MNLLEKVVVPPSTLKGHTSDRNFLFLLDKLDFCGQFEAKKFWNKNYCFESNFYLFDR